MGQSNWAGACAFIMAASFVLHVRAEEAEKNPFEADEASVTEPAHGRAHAARRIEYILDQPLRSPLEYPQTPLNTITGIIAEEYDLPIVFDTAALDAIAVSPEVEVTVDLNNVTLRSALDLMLKQVEDLTYIIDKEVLLFTTEDEANTRLEVRVYPVEDLVNEQASDGSHVIDEDRFDDLLDVVISTVEADSWEENGTGEGEILPFAPAMFVVSQTHRVHEQINDLFAEIRRVKSQIEANTPVKSMAHRPVTRGLVVSAKELTEAESSRAALKKAILHSVPWRIDGAHLSDDEVFLEVFPNRVLVRHLPSVVREVERVLEKWGASPDSSAPTKGMGFSGVEDGKVSGRGGL